MSLALTVAFGRDTEGGQWTLSFLMDKVLSNLEAWSSEAALMDDTLQLLVAMVEKREKYVHAGAVSFFDSLTLL